MPARKTTLSLGLLIPLLGVLAACAGPQGPQLSGPDGPMISNNDWNEHNYGMGYYSGPYNDGFEAEGLDGGPPDYMGDAFFTGP
ncbi:hypothetical protein B0W47_07020 [Komagataeibacter nataicola]|uniref:Lipoprotein n=1 Tax=Komagataeibacter nataicola TaxID=265960 RepID=A0A9N7CL11_9PROT|nr:hypothetical protein [Komagataeibacter nataicola]AQU87263.1 hypothetical protein B0W47_07020 [Komagataeibacter nataicola]PYD67472.1 hypothetical protein CDI09_02810 [Komagataeibacter nataicola]WEQ55848.1 hypothetical protein LV564_01650 [Komagataeibacter nataicola]WNM09290.1 hypothetical protein RI056_04715 [Komagataeibacter nataicola]GBR14815.1 hypothetical protein AA0616_0403 [Komagataeibacter nataicola NRIC 0616]